MVNRLQQPTHSYLARSRSAMSLSGDQTGNMEGSLFLESTEDIYTDTRNCARSICAVYGLLIRMVSDVNQIWPDLKHYAV